MKCTVCLHVRPHPHTAPALAVDAALPAHAHRHGDRRNLRCHHGTRCRGPCQTRLDPNGSRADARGPRGILRHRACACRRQNRAGKNRRTRQAAGHQHARGNPDRTPRREFHPTRRASWPLGFRQGKGRGAGCFDGRTNCHRRNQRQGIRPWRQSAANP